ncbi:hypothetical protein ACS0TY_018843 [Phlomoides rotata]
MIQDRIPTIRNLLYRGAYNSNYSPKCRVCVCSNEDTSHLFFVCRPSNNVWKRVYFWLGMDTWITETGRDHMEAFHQIMRRQNQESKQLNLIMYYLEHLALKKFDYFCGKLQFR